MRNRRRIKVIMVANYSHSWFLNPSGLQPLVIEDSSGTFLEGYSARRDQEQGGFRHKFARFAFPAHLVGRRTVASQGYQWSRVRQNGYIILHAFPSSYSRVGIISYSSRIISYSSKSGATPDPKSFSQNISRTNLARALASRRTARLASQRRLRCLGPDSYNSSAQILLASACAGETGWK